MARMTDAKKKPIPQSKLNDWEDVSNQARKIEHEIAFRQNQYLILSKEDCQRQKISRRNLWEFVEQTKAKYKEIPIIEPSDAETILFHVKTEHLHIRSGELYIDKKWIPREFQDQIRTISLALSHPDASKPPLFRRGRVHWIKKEIIV